MSAQADNGTSKNPDFNPGSFYFDTQDMGGHWAQMSEAHFEVSLEKTYLVAVDE